MCQCQSCTRKCSLTESGTVCKCIVVEREREREGEKHFYLFPLLLVMTEVTASKAVSMVTTAGC